MDIAGDMQANGEEDKSIQNVWLENLNKINHVEDHTLHGKIRFKCIMKKVDGTMLTNLAQYINTYPANVEKRVSS